MEPDALDAFFPTERITFSAKAGTAEKISSYVTTFPDVWATQSHFIRAAIARYLEEQKRAGRHVTKRKEARQ